MILDLQRGEKPLGPSGNERSYKVLDLKILASGNRQLNSSLIMDAIKYHTHLLPSELSPEMVGRFAAISRQAIQSAPARIMFMGQQLGRTDGQWAQEAKRADMHHLICVSSKDDSTSSLEQNKWVGIAIVRGPLSPSEYNHPISIASGAA